MKSSLEFTDDEESCIDTRGFKSVAYFRCPLVDEELVRKAMVHGVQPLKDLGFIAVVVVTGTNLTSLSGQGKLQLYQKVCHLPHRGNL